MNSILQALFQTREIGHCRHQSSVVKAWCKLRKQYDSTMEGVINPTEFKKELDDTKQFEGKGSQDSVGFLTILLDMLPCESSLFKGKLKSRIRCVTCGWHSDKCDDFTVLTLPITGTDLDTIYKNFTSVEENVTYKCEKCKQNTIHTKKITIKKFPQRLIISLKRFTSKLTIIRSHVDFPVKRLVLDGIEYTLYAIVEYQGSYKGGHYIVTVYNFDDDIWRVYNDSLVSDRIFQKEEFLETAYILFYEKLP